jgi:hypothetical protein
MRPGGEARTDAVRAVAGHALGGVDEVALHGIRIRVAIDHGVGRLFPILRVIGGERIFLR